MNPASTTGPSRRLPHLPSGGLIGVFVRHPTAPNLLMAVMILFGIFSLMKLNRQFFPNIEIPAISVSVPWPGASAEDVESNILEVLEPELRFLDEVSEVTSIAREGSGVISIEFNSNADLQKAQSDVEQAVNRITTLPEDSERPIVSRAAMFDGVASLSLTGPFSEQALKTFGKQIRDELLATGIDRVTMNGARDEEIWIRLREADLRRLGLTLQEVSEKVRQNTQDLPAGKLEGEAEIQLRSKAERKTPETIGDIEVKSGPAGDKVFLKDIAEIDTRFEREGKIGLMRGQPAIELAIQRAQRADTLKTMEILNRYLDAKRPTLPESLQVNVYDVRGKFVAQRLGILIENGLQGLAIVLLLLFLFLNARVAFWVAAGIPVALLAALGVMYLTGQSINMVSMFALIMMTGIIVDDAIVVGEQTATLEENGMNSVDAAQAGAIGMLAPVSAAMITTLCSFFPIVVISGRMGDILIAIPLVVVAVLIASLIECFLILPGHLRHGETKKRKPWWIRQKLDQGFNWLRDGPVNAIVRTAYAWRYTTAAILIASLFLAIGMIAGDRVGFRFFPSPESENLTAAVEFAPGIPRSQQIAALSQFEEALYRAEKKLLATQSTDVPIARPAAPTAATGQETGEASQIDRVIKQVGQWFGVGPDEKKRETQLVEAVFTMAGKAGRIQNDNVAQLGVQLVASEQRSIRTKQIVKAWREAVPRIAGVERLSISGRRPGPPGRDVDVRLQSAPVETLKAAAEELRQALTGFPGVSGITDDLPYGKQEYVFEVNPRGTALGFTGQSIGTQVRRAFEGAISIRFARGDDEITVRVMRRQSEGGRQDLVRFHLTTAAGDRVPLTEVVNISERRSFSIVQRKDGIRTVAITGDIDPEVTSTEEVVARLNAEVMPGLAAKYGVGYIYKGRDEERRDSFRDLKQGALLAFCLIYITLAWVFGSYWKPFSVMLIIPFGLVGAIFGHYIMGQALTIISMIGLLGLSGILVNDSIVLVSRINERLATGETLEEAAVGGARDRFRAVLLTSLTTVGGLTPLLFETSRQAQFLIPMATTLVFGLAAATILVLLLVPSLLGISADIGHALQKVSSVLFGSRDRAEPHPHSTAPPAPGE
ncbi:MAG: efflux RND transporter permease subunit [Alphaproteobacteria bacterium]|nr:efflux RND transporter permease subunit [Alphaproteobacteria bacterium]